MNIVPRPKKFQENGTITVLPQFETEGEKLIFCKKAFMRMVKKLYNIHLRDGNEGFLLCFKESVPEDGYELDGKIVYASSCEGARYGLATLLQIMEPNEDESFTVRNTKISEKPDKDFRAFCSDLARAWHPVETLIDYVDLCYINKIKYLQLHFTDDESWTLPFDCFPNAATPGRCYTKQEIAFLVEYANEAGIELIPEFEGIGHSSALIKSYPDVFGNEFIEEPDYVDNIMCIGRPDIFDNVKAFLTEMCEIFKYSKYIHVGCDEARYFKWDNCRLCKAYMEKNGIENSLALYSHFVKIITDMCLSLGRKPIVWEGFPKEGSEGISREVIVAEFESYYQLAPELIEQGFRVINASWKPLYIVHPIHAADRQWKVIEENYTVYTWQNCVEKSPATKAPIVVEPTDMVPGGMLCQWECSPRLEKGQLLVNLPMAADRFWNEKDFYGKDEFEDNCKKLRKMQKKLAD